MGDHQEAVSAQVCLVLRDPVLGDADAGQRSTQSPSRGTDRGPRQQVDQVAADRDVAKAGDEEEGPKQVASEAAPLCPARGVRTRGFETNDVSFLAHAFAEDGDPRHVVFLPFKVFDGRCQSASVV